MAPIRSFRPALLALLTLVLAPAVAPAADSWTYVGTAGAPANTEDTRLTGINAAGAVSGYAFKQGPQFKYPIAFRWDKGVGTRTLPSLTGGCDFDTTAGISEAGVVAGSSCAVVGQGASVHAVAWSPSLAVTDINAGFRDSEARVVSAGGRVGGQGAPTLAAPNDAAVGTVAGGFGSAYDGGAGGGTVLDVDDAGHVLHTFRPSTYADIEFKLNGTVIPGYGLIQGGAKLRADGKVLGFKDAQDTTGLFDGATFTPLADLPGALATYAVFTSAAGPIFGFAQIPNSAAKPIVWDTPASTPRVLSISNFSGIAAISRDGKALLFKDGDVFRNAARRKISGRVLTDAGQPVMGVTVTLTPAQGPAVSAVTGADGRYSKQVDPGVYTATPSDASGRGFLPAQATIDVRTADAARDFTSVALRVVGLIVQGEDGTSPTAIPSRGVPVEVKGTTSKGQAFTGRGASGGDGRYAVPVPRGSYTVTFPATVCVAGKAGCVQTAKVAPTDKDVTVDAVARSGDLQLEVTPLKVRLEQEAAGPVEQVVDVKVTVTNRGQIPVANVLLVDSMQVGYADVAPSVMEVPVRSEGPPAKAKLGTLAPGKSATTTYPMRVRGDGAYDMSTLVTGKASDGRDVLGAGSGRIEVESVAVVTKLEMGRKETSPLAPQLIQAGSAFTVKVHVHNRSYVRNVVLAPFGPALRGNALDGHMQLANIPIPELESVDAAAPSSWIELAPRQEHELEVIVRTAASNAFVDGARPTGGTSATATFEAPTGFDTSPEGALGAPLKAADVLLAGDTTYRVGIDDRAPPTEPFDYFTAAGVLAQGTFTGLQNFATGTVRAVLIDLPIAIGRGLRAVPGAAIRYTQAEAELWNEVRDDPLLRTLFLNMMTRQALLAYRYAPRLAEQADGVIKGANAAAAAHYERLWKSWYAGDWKGALREFAAETTEGGANLALGLAPGVLARVPGVTAKITRVRAAIMAGVTEDLATNFPRALSVFESIKALKKTVVDGYAFSDRQLRQLYGYSVAETRFLRTYARTNRLIIVARSRATESVRWIKKFGAVLKPEGIKLKNTDWNDFQFLGYRKKDIGRVVIPDRPRKLSEVKTALTEQGFGPKDPEWQAAVERLEQRRKEYTKTADGYVKDLEAAARKREMRLRWNAAENAMDPRVAKNSYRTYEFRLRREGSVRIPEFRVGGKWRSITGDMDLLQITHADGRPLLDVERLKVYKDLAESVTGLMHPESATWTLLKENKFDFAMKTGEFVRSEIPPVQFAPDGLARRVTFIEELSYFKDKLDYRIFWKGGYGYTGRRR